MINTKEKLVTYTGKYVDPFAMRPEDVHLSDIAHGLSMCCRYAGQCQVFYSVAQHSVFVYDRVKAGGGSKYEQKVALLHDASEAYVHDICTATKRRLGDYQQLEDYVLGVIFTSFGLPVPEKLPDRVINADFRMLITEREQIINEQFHVWAVQHDYKSYPDVRIHSWDPVIAETAFLEAAGTLL